MILTRTFYSFALGWMSCLLLASPAIATEVPSTSRKLQPATRSSIAAMSAFLPEGQPLNGLTQQLNAFQRSYFNGLEVGIAMMDMQSGDYVSINGDRVYPTASIIKLPILIALFQEVDAGRIRLDELLTLSREAIVGGSGSMQYQRPGTQFTVLETATRMITISDNTATNLIVKRMGGIQGLNQRFQHWGLHKTEMQNNLPDRYGTNVTTATELVQLLAMLDQRQLLSASSQARVMQIMSQVRDRTLLPAGLGPGARIAHKTGDIGFLQGDAGIVQMPSGKRYLVAMLVKRDRSNDPSAKAFIQQASRLVYSYLNQPITPGVRLF